MVGSCLLYGEGYVEEGVECGGAVLASGADDVATEHAPEDEIQNGSVVIEFVENAHEELVCVVLGIPPEPESSFSFFAPALLVLPASIQQSMRVERGRALGIVPFGQSSQLLTHTALLLLLLLFHFTRTTNPQIVTAHQRIVEDTRLKNTGHKACVPQIHNTTHTQKTRTPRTRHT